MAGIGEIPARSTMHCYYKLDGNSNDASGNAHNGVDANMSYGLGYGKFNQGAYFNASTSKINIGGFTVGQAFTLSFWIYITSIPSAYAYLFAASSQSRGLTIKSTNKLAYFNSSGEQNNNTALASNQWVHVCLIGVSGGIGTFYINSKADGTFAGTLTWAPIEIGRSNANLYPFGGYMDEIVCDNRTWTYEELKKYYSQCKGRFVPQ